MPHPDRLFHLTWLHHADSIRRHGLVPSHTPNRWAGKGALERSRGRLFLCDESRVPHWTMLIADGWCEWPAFADLIVVEVDARGLDLTADSAPGEDYDGDFWTTQVIDPARLSGFTVAVAH